MSITVFYFFLVCVMMSVVILPGALGYLMGFSYELKSIFIKSRKK